MLEHASWHKHGLPEPRVTQTHPTAWTGVGQGHVLFYGQITGGDGHGLWLLGVMKVVGHC